jgi:hypothetical protein
MKLSLEHKIVLLCSRGTLHESHREELRNMISISLDWKEIFFQATVHRTLNLLFYHLRKLNLLDSVDQEVRRLMEINYKAIGMRNTEYFTQFTKIGEEFNKRGIGAAVLKGMLLCGSVYPAIETRYFNDLDFLVKKSDIKAVTESLTVLGYVQGHYDQKTEKVVEASKKQKIYHQMTTHELQVFLKMSENPFAKVLEVDINHNILWVGNCPYEVDHELMLSRLIEVEINGTKALRLNYEDCLIQLCCHLYKEATILHWIKDLKDLKIYKFADIQIYIEKYGSKINWQDLLLFVKANKLEKVVYYVFHYVNLMYEETVPAHILVSIEPKNKRFLDEYGIENSEPSVWEFAFFTRLFDSNRVLSTVNTGASTFYATRDSL